MPASRNEIINWIFAQYGEPEQDNELLEVHTERYLAVEVGAGMYDHRLWYSTNDNPIELIERLLGQEHPEDWQWPEVYDLATAQRLEWENVVRITGSNSIAPELDDPQV